MKPCLCSERFDETDPWHRLPLKQVGVAGEVSFDDEVAGEVVHGGEPRRAGVKGAGAKTTGKRVRVAHGKHAPEGPAAVACPLHNEEGKMKLVLPDLEKTGGHDPVAPAGDHG